MSASNYLEEATLNFWFRGQSITPPNDLYLALYINDPTDSDTGTEVKGGGYLRQIIRFEAPTQTQGKGTITNSNKVEFPIAESDWGQISHWGVRTAQSGGQLLNSGQFSRLETIREGNKFIIEKGNLEITMD